MPATNAWDETQPLGTALASSIDDVIRQLKLDIRERLNIQHYFGVNQTDDGRHRGLVVDATGAVTVAYLTGTNIAAPAGQMMNLGGSAATGLLINNTAATSKLIDLQKSGVSKMSVDQDGVITGNGSGLTNLVATAIATGLVPTARLAGGSADATTFLRGDQVWAAPPTGPNPFISYGADQSGNFSASVETIYNFTAAGITVQLPTVVGNGGKRIGLINKNGFDITIKGNGTDTIAGVNSFVFSSSQYDSTMLYADAAGGKWDMI